MKQKREWPPTDVRVGYSHELPARYVRSRGKIQFRFNIEQIIGPEGEPQYKFNYVYADEPTEASVLDRLEKNKVDKKEEILKESLLDGKVKVTELKDKQEKDKLK